MTTQESDREEAVADVLASLPEGWVVLGEVPWPEGDLVPADHVVVGTGGVFVITTKNWAGPITLRNGVLRQHGRPRDAVLGWARDAAAAISALVPELAVPPVPVLCFLDAAPEKAECDHVVVCSGTQLRDELVSRPEVLDGDQVRSVAWALRMPEPPARPRARWYQSPYRGQWTRDFTIIGVVAVVLTTLLLQPDALTSLWR